MSLLTHAAEKIYITEEYKGHSRHPLCDVGLIIVAATASCQGDVLDLTVP